MGVFTRSVGMSAALAGAMATSPALASGAGHVPEAVARHVLVLHDSFESVRGGAATIRSRAAMVQGPGWLELRPELGEPREGSPSGGPGTAVGAKKLPGDVDPSEDAAGGAAFYESSDVVREVGTGAGRLFTQALVSWNVEVPAGCAVRMDVMVRDAGDGSWSRTLFVGSWSGGGEEGSAVAETLGPSERVQKTGDGVVVDVDYVRSTRPLDALRYRFTAVRGGPVRSGGATPGDAPIRVHRVAVCMSDARSQSEAGDGDFKPARIGRLGVPFRSQKTGNESLTGRLCSPASVSMVLAHRGVDVPLERFATGVQDPNFGIFGNWPRNVQAAFALGVPGYLTRMNSWADLARATDAGQPVIISIAAEPGELRDAPYETTAGHLIVVEGFDERGDVLVNDPAVADAAQGQRTYKREDLTNVWLRRVDGTAYVLLPRAGEK